MEAAKLADHQMTTSRCEEGGAAWPLGTQVGAWEKKQIRETLSLLWEGGAPVRHLHVQRKGTGVLQFTVFK